MTGSPSKKHSSGENSSTQTHAIFLFKTLSYKYTVLFWSVMVYCIRCQIKITCCYEIVVVVSVSARVNFVVVAVVIRPALERVINRHSRKLFVSWMWKKNNSDLFVIVVNNWVCCYYSNSNFIYCYHFIPQCKNTTNK